MKATQSFAPVTLTLETYEEFYVVAHLLMMSSTDTVKDWFMADDHNIHVVDFPKVQELREKMVEILEALNPVITEPEGIPKGLRR